MDLFRWFSLVGIIKPPRQLCNQETLGIPRAVYAVPLTWTDSQHARISAKLYSNNHWNISSSQMPTGWRGPRLGRFSTAAVLQKRYGTSFIAFYLVESHDQLGL